MRNLFVARYCVDWDAEIIHGTDGRQPCLALGTHHNGGCKNVYWRDGLDLLSSW